MSGGEGGIDCNRRLVAQQRLVRLALPIVSHSHVIMGFSWGSVSSSVRGCICIDRGHYLVLHCVAQVVERVLMLRRERDRLLVAANRLLERAKLLQRVACRCYLICGTRRSVCTRGCMVGSGGNAGFRVLWWRRWWQWRGTITQITIG